MLSSHSLSPLANIHGFPQPHLVEVANNAVIGKSEW